MKKIVLGIMVILGLGTSQLSAQNISFGVKADATMSNYILSDMDNLSSKMGFGFNAGGFAKIDLIENFAIQPELLLNFRTAEFKENGKKRDFEYWGLELPVYAVGQWYTPGNNRFYAGVGPYIGYGFSAKMKSPETKLYKNDTLKRFDFGFGAQVGYEFTNRLSVNASYKIGVIDALDKGSDDGTMLPQRISLGLAYRF